MAARAAHTMFVSALWAAGPVLADGVGLIGYDTTMYRPLCAAACRGAIESAPLLCTPHDAPVGGAHSHGSTPADCHATDMAFMQTLAFCIFKRCSSQNVTADALETYWALHEVNGARTLLDPKPAMSYSEAVNSIKKAPDTEYVAGEMLNVTSLISDLDYQSQFNALGLFEKVEMGHSKYSLVVILAGVLVPIFASGTRYLPFPGPLRSRLSATLNHPALFGVRHRRSLPANSGYLPTRGQSFFIGFLLLLNLFVCVLDITPGPQPNAWYIDSWQQVMGYLSDRAGALAFANVTLMFIFSARNNPLLFITDWSYDTYLLLHRWVGYMAIVQAAVHCLMWLHWYVKDGTHNIEAREPYWYWGIIGILAMCLIWPLSLLPIRQRLYEFFLLSHITLTILTIAGFWYHIWYLYEDFWGYQIWIYIMMAFWSSDRLLRIWRFLRNGIRYATLTKIDDDYFRIDIDGVSGHGYAFLYFPTVRLSFWENHPFSIASRFVRPRTTIQAPDAVDEQKVCIKDAIESKEEPANPYRNGAVTVTGDVPRPRLTFVCRVRGGITKDLAGRIGSSLPVLVEPYNSPVQNDKLGRCTTLVGIAGGVGITSLLQLLHTHPGSRARLYWGMRHATLRDSLAAETAGLDIACSIGERLDLRAILEQELLRKDEGGVVGIAVSGPAGMSDDTRDIVCQIASSGKAVRDFVFIDEAFSW